MRKTSSSGKKIKLFSKNDQKCVRGALGRRNAGGRDLFQCIRTTIGNLPYDSDDKRQLVLKI